MAPSTSIHALMYAILLSSLLVAARPTRQSSNSAVSNQIFNGNTTNLDVVAAELGPLSKLIGNHRGDAKLFERADLQHASLSAEPGSDSTYTDSMSPNLPGANAPQHDDIGVDEALATGKTMLALLADHPNTSPELWESRFKIFEDLERHGWTWNDRPPSQHDPKLQLIMAKLNIGPFYGIDDIEVKHDTQTMIAQMEFPATGAVYRNYYDFHKNAIVSTIFHTTESSSGFGEGYDNLLPPLKDWSDVTYLTLERFSRSAYPTALDSVEEVVFAGIFDNPTITILDYVVEQVGKGFDRPETVAYPGVRFHAKATNENEREGFVAIMGTPVGAGVAKLLGQHRDRMGLSQIKTIDVFCDDCNSACPEPVVVFRLENVPETGVGGTKGEQLGESEVEWNDAVAKGMRSVQLLELPPASAASQRGPWREWNELAKHGWTMRKSTPEQVKLVAAFQGMAIVSEELSIGTIPQLQDYTCEHEQSSVFDGKTWVPSQYSNYHDIEEGAIIVYDALSPQGNQAKGMIPATGPLPPLAHWSDVTFLAFKRLTATNPAALKGLRTIIWGQVSNELFRNIFEWKLSGENPEPEPHELDWEHRWILECGSEDFLAFMGTAPGVGVAHLLAQHKAELGWLHVVRIEIFCGSDHLADDGLPEPYIVFHLENLDGTDTARQTAQQRLTARDDLRTNASAPAKRGDAAPLTLAEAIRAGRDLANQMDDTSNKGSASNFIHLADLTTRGWTKTKQVDGMPSDDDDFVASTDLILDKHRGHEKLQLQKWRHTETVTVGNVEYAATNGKYDNAYSPGVIIANDNESPNSMTPKQRPPVTGPLPKLQHWSQVVAIVYLELFRTAELEAVVHRKVTEPRSRVVIQQIIAASSGKINPQKAKKPDDLSFSPGDDAYYALLGIPNGKSVYYLLSQYRDILGERCVKAIHIWWRTGAPYLWYGIGQAPCGEGIAGSSKQTLQLGAAANVPKGGSSKNTPKQLKPAIKPAKPQLTTSNAAGSLLQPERESSGHQGRQKRADSAEAALLSRCLQAGAAFASQLNSARYHDSRPSQFRAGQLEDATSSSGWCLDQAGSMAFTAPPLASALEIMGIKNGGPLHIRTWSLAPDPEEEDEETPLNAGYYAKGLIVAVDNLSPSHTMGPDAALPELQYWSDIAFLQYKQLYPQNRLKNIIRQGVIEDDTIKVVEAIRHSRGLSDDRYNSNNYPRAPDLLVLAYGTPHFNAMLGTAGGKGVANMLLQHRQDLGHRCVQEITIWYGPDKDLPHVWFRIQDAPCGLSVSRSGRSKRAVAQAATEKSKDDESHGEHEIRAMEDEREILKKFSISGAGWALGLDDVDPDFGCQSIWTAGQLHQATTAWGWTLTADEVTTASHLHTAHRALNFMYNRQPYQILVRKVTWRHNNQVVISGHTIEPTRAEYTNYYLSAAIVATFNESPKHRGLSEGIKTNDVENLPALRSWADITFLQYAQIFPNRPLVAIIQQNVFNTETKEVVDAIRHVVYVKQDQPVLEDYPQFPGIKLKYGTKGFQALLGVPVGESIVHMLSQHRDDLGHRCVYEIWVFYNIDMENPTIWYRIKEAPCGPPRAQAAATKRSVDESLSGR